MGEGGWVAKDGASSSQSRQPAVRLQTPASIGAGRQLEDGGPECSTFSDFPTSWLSPVNPSSSVTKQCGDPVVE